MEAHEAFDRYEKSHHAASGGGGEPSFTMQAALTVAVIAGFLAIATFLTNETIKEAIQNQTKSADAHAQSIAFAGQQEVLVLSGAILRAQSAAQDPGLSQTSKAGADAADKQQPKLEESQKALDEQAKEANSEVNDANDQHLIYELSVVGLQIGIVLASVAIIARRKFLLWGGTFAAIVGVVLLGVGLAAG